MSAALTDGNIPIKKKRRKQNLIKIVDETPTKYTNSYSPKNLTEQKDKFLKHGILPSFTIRASASQVQLLAQKLSGKVSHEYLAYAVKILEAVRERHHSGDEFMKYSYGEVIDTRTASAILTQYLNENGLDGQISIVWTKDLDCSARMMWHGPSTRYNKPEARKHTLIIKNSPDNAYLRQKGITCLANHEIGTHFIRTINDGLQPWYADRKLFGLRSTRSYHMSKTEEGLASLNTVLEAKGKYLFGPALLYYTACKAETMTFEELFHHLEQYIGNPEKRWHHVMRVKRHLADPNCVGGLGKDQCYFEGAIEILKDVDNLELPLIFSGKLCHDETSRIKRLARLDCIKTPAFLEDVEKYRRQLKWIGYINGVLPKPQPERRGKGKRGSKNIPVRPGGRENNSRNANKTIQATPVIAVPSNMTLVLQPPDETKSEQQQPHIIDIQHEYETANSSVENKQSLTDGKCILEKIATKLSFHDDLLRKVDSRLNSASLSIKQSEKLMLNGLRAHSGVISSPNPENPTFEGEDNSRESCYSPVCYETLRTMSRKMGKPGLVTSYSTSVLLPQRSKDHGEYFVQPRPPNQMNPNPTSQSFDEHKIKRSTSSRCSARNGERTKDGITLLRRGKSSLSNEFLELYQYT